VARPVGWPGWLGGQASWVARPVGWPGQLGGQASWVARPVGWPRRLGGQADWVAKPVGWPGRLIRCCVLWAFWLFVGLCEYDIQTLPVFGG